MSEFQQTPQEEPASNQPPVSSENPADSQSNPSDNPSENPGFYEPPAITLVSGEDDAVDNSGNPADDGNAPAPGENGNPSESPENPAPKNPNPGEQPIGEDLTVLKSELEAAKAEREALKAQLEARPSVSEELLNTVLSDEFYNDVAQVKAMSPLGLMLQKIEKENPYLVGDPEGQMEFLQRQFPDIDPEISENLGLSGLDWKRFKYEADGVRSDLLQSAKDKMKESLSQFKATAGQNAEEKPFNAEEYVAQVVTPHVDGAVKAFKMPEMPKIEGVELKGITPEELREAALVNPVAYEVDETNGQLLPSIPATFYRLQYEKLLSQIGPMAQELTRKAPKITQDAITQSLNNAPPPSRSSAVVNPAGVGAKKPDGLYQPPALLSVR